MVKSKANTHNWTIITVVIAGVVIGSAFFIVKVLNVNPLRSDASSSEPIFSFISHQGGFGTTINAGEAQTLKWSQNGGSSPELVNIYIRKLDSYGNFIEYYRIVNNFQSFPGTNGYEFILPSGFSGDAITDSVAFVIVTNKIYNQVPIRYNSSNFSMISDGRPITPPDINVVTPSYGNVLYGDTDYRIKWNQSNRTTEPVYVKISLRNQSSPGKDLLIIADSALSEAGENSFTWAVPSEFDGDRYFIQVRLDRQWPNPHFREGSSAQFSIREKSK